MNPRDLSKLSIHPNMPPGGRCAIQTMRVISAFACRACSLACPTGPDGTRRRLRFEEDTDGHRGEKYAWMNAAYAMAATSNRAFKEYGWCARIRGVQSGGEVEELPTHTFPTDDGGVDLKCPTEIAISDRREAELAKSGLIPLIHRKNTDRAAFIGAQSLFKPKPIRTTRTRRPRAICRPVCPICSPAAASRTTSKSWCATRSVRITRASNCNAGSATGSVSTSMLDPQNSSEATKCRRPLAAAQISITANEENPATTRRRSSSVPTSSSKAWTSDCGSSPDCPLQKPSFRLNPDQRAANQEARLS